MGCLKRRGALIMDKSELLSSVLTFEGNIGMWKIVLNQITKADFVMGYGFDENMKKWKVYQNNERGIMSEWVFDKEEEAIEKLLRKIEFEHKVSH